MALSLSIRAAGLTSGRFHALGRILFGDWRQLEIPAALTRYFCYRREVVAS
jgi:hypothetical protein